MLSMVGAPTPMILLTAILGLLPPFAQTSAWLLTETLTQASLVAAIFGILRYQRSEHRLWLIAASLLLAIAALTRPSFQLAAPLLAVALVMSRFRRRPMRAHFAEVAILVSATLISAVLYAAYCRLRLGNAGMTSRLGLNLAVRATPLYPYLSDPTTREVLLQARNDAFVHGEWVDQCVYKAQPELLRRLNMTEPQLEAWLQSQALLVIRQHPVQYLDAVATSFTRIWFPYETKLPLLSSQRIRAVWYAMQFALVGCLAIGAAGFVVFLAARRFALPIDAETRATWTLWCLAMVLVVSNALVSCMLDMGDPRHRVSTELLILAAASAGALGIRRIWFPPGEGRPGPGPRPDGSAIPASGR
jgi:hypothetical protein